MALIFGFQAIHADPRFCHTTQAIGIDPTGQEQNQGLGS